MRTLIIFDNSGVIFYQASGDVKEPSGGVNFMWVDVPDNSYIDSVDMSGDTPTPVIKQFEKPRDSIQEQIDEINAVLLELILSQGTEVDEYDE